MRGDSQQAGVGEFDFGVAECRRVAVIGGDDIVDHHFAHSGEGADKFVKQAFGLALYIVDGFCVLFGGGEPAVGDCALDFGQEQVADFLELFAEEGFKIFGFRRIDAGEHDVDQRFERVDHLVGRRIVP